MRSRTTSKPKRAQPDAGTEPATRTEQATATEPATPPARAGSAASRPRASRPAARPSTRPGTMRHKGYTAKVVYDDEAGLLRGEVIDLADEIRFEATGVAQLKQEFHAAVDAYLLDCATRGVEPAKPFSGRLLLRLPPELHRSATITAAALDVSLNDFMVGCIEVGVARIAAVKREEP